MGADPRRLSSACRPIRSLHVPHEAPLHPRASIAAPPSPGAVFDTISVPSSSPTFAVLESPAPPLEWFHFCFLFTPDSTSSVNLTSADVRPPSNTDTRPHPPLQTAPSSHLYSESGRRSYMGSEIPIGHEVRIDRYVL